MIIYVLNNKSHYEIMSLTKAFYNNKTIIIKQEKLPKDDENDYILAEVTKEDNIFKLYLKVNIEGNIIIKNKNLLIENKSEIEKQRLYKRIFTKLLYEVLSKKRNIELEWGSITGVRPVKLITTRINKKISEKDIIDEFRNDFYVSEKRIKLALKIAENQKSIINDIRDKEFSLYINIPFCPSRCYYCSFISSSIKQSIKIIPEYIKKLVEEIKHTANIVNDIGLKLKTIYIGGGTPTVLSKKELFLLLSTINNNFDLSNLIEYTVEAGRPDTINIENLKILSSAKVTRISINPQTLNDKTLALIGRNHSVNDFYKSYELASKYFKNINSDVIAGLKEENLDDFKYTINALLKLNPSNITIHCLARKKSSKLAKNIIDFKNNDVLKMLDYAYDKLDNNKYTPYYLYRQKNSIDNLENTGFFRGAKENICKYNIYMMEEVNTVISCGAGSVTKIVNHNNENNKINRIFNYKYPFEYIKNFNEIIKRKEETYKSLQTIKSERKSENLTDYNQIQ